MDFKDYLEVLKEFVPQPYQTTAKNFNYYLQTLNEKKYDIRYSSLFVTDTGIRIVIYRPAYTGDMYLTWSGVRAMVDNHFKESFPTILEQLKMSF